MNVDDEPTSVRHLITPGETVTSDSAFMRGHGTYNDGENLVGTVVGTAERINKLISVKPFRTRYSGEIGDVVVGRISEISQKRWKVDIGARQDAALLLAAVNLPGGELLLSEGDLISAEIQAFFHDGGSSLHTRSLKYGKLRTGSFITVPSFLIKRAKSHFLLFTLPQGIIVNVVLGMNGFIYVSKGSGVQNGEEILQQDPEALYSNKNDIVSDDERLAIARICNCILALAKENQMITESYILQIYEASTQMEVFDIIANSRQLVDVAKMNL
ncbi:exosome non-catalytic core subunit rrp4 [Entophlyctis luteolus]|nr:exosome non-catalytic core subunit rrp4 [Entophlyctis luteolus]